MCRCSQAQALGCLSQCTNDGAACLVVRLLVSCLGFTYIYIHTLLGCLGMVWTTHDQTITGPRKRMTCFLAFRVTDCIACGHRPTITAETLPQYSYSDFTGQQPHDSAPPELRVLPRELRQVASHAVSASTEVERHHRHAKASFCTDI